MKRSWKGNWDWKVQGDKEEKVGKTDGRGDRRERRLKSEERGEGGRGDRKERI